MKKILTLIVFLAGLQLAQAQNAKKYLMFEHFTNTNCSTCANQNPGFFDKIDNYPNDIHHISIHPPIPYSSCVLYQANPLENEARTSFYNILGTPRVVWNGLEQTSASSVSTFGIEERIAETSPISITVEETLSINRSCTVKIKTVGEKPTGNFKVFVAIVERQLFYDAPNGENVHHNVFRQMITNINGDDFTPEETGLTVTLDYIYPLNPDWGDPSEIYTLAWVHDLNTSQILNSGTRFDANPNSINELPAEAVFEIAPNPSNGQFFLTLEKLNLTHNTALIYNTLGQLVKEINLEPQTNQQSLDLSSLQTGTYVLKISTKEGDFTKKIVKLN